MSFTRTSVRSAQMRRPTPFYGPLLATGILAVCITGEAVAKPQIEIDCSTTDCGAYTAGSLPFSLYYNTSASGQSTWLNYVSVDVYQGTTLVSGPTDDPHGPYSSLPVGTNPCSAGMGSNCSEPVSATNGETIVLNVSGEWNANSCSQTLPSGEPPCGCCYYFRRGRRCVRYCCNYNRAAQCCARLAGDAADPFVWADDPVPVSGQSRTFDVNLHIVNSTNTTEWWRFTYALFKKSSLTDPNVHITPLKETGDNHVFYHLRTMHNQGGQSDAVYSVGTSHNSANPFPAGDLRIRLASLSPVPSTSDYVYLDVFAVNLLKSGPGQTVGVSYPLTRIPIQIPQNP
jgi:hypothetical protein